MLTLDPAAAAASGTGSGTAPSTPASGAGGENLSETEVQEKLKKGEELSWEDIIGSTTASMVKPENGGPWREDPGVLIPWVGKAPDQPCNMFTWDEDKKKHVLIGREHDETLQNVLQPPHPGMCRPIGVKEERKTQAACTEFSGDPFEGISNKNKEGMSISTCKDKVRNHLIKTGMMIEFMVPDPKEPAKNHDIVKNDDIIISFFMKNLYSNTHNKQK